MSHPTWVRGLKLSASVPLERVNPSHPTWVRGLKLIMFYFFDLTMQSHPTWVRGLKQIHHDQNREILYVAPYVGAWIETLRLADIDR